MSTNLRICIIVFSYLVSSVMSAEKNGTEWILAHNYSSDFHVAFAMLAFTTILIAVLVFGLSVAMWNMDPGRDSIIYRMTSQRMKKEQ